LTICGKQIVLTGRLHRDGLAYKIRMEEIINFKIFRIILNRGNKKILTHPVTEGSEAMPGSRQQKPDCKRL